MNLPHFESLARRGVACVTLECPVFPFSLGLWQALVGPE
jgi:hypothetical protein